MYKNFLKRLLDLILSLFAIILLIIPMIIIAVMIKIDSKGPVIFVQERVGKHKKNFKILKFRTMKVETSPDVPTHEMQDSEKWITKVGRFLRKTSIDEIPQIFNIFIGHMSIVGPRPALWNQYDLIEERDKYGANDIRPGLTGLAQINGRDELEISVKAKFDGKYVEELNKGKFKGVAIDCKCFWGTIFSVLRKEGVKEGRASDINNEETQDQKEVIEEVAISEMEKDK